MRGRSDLQRYHYACDELQNFFVTKQGPAIKRSGTRFVRRGIAPNARSRLIPFIVSENQAYIIELGSNKLRFYRNNGAVLETAQVMTVAPTTANPVVVTVPSHGYNTGDSVYVTGSLMTELNGRFFDINKLDVDTFELIGENGTGRSTGLAGSVSRHYNLVDGVGSNSVPWSDSDYDKIKFVQNGDLLYFVDGVHQVHELVRNGDTSWTCKELAFTYPPFETENITDTAVIVGNSTIGANTTITSTADLFTSADVGRLITIGDVMKAENGKWVGGIGTSPPGHDAMARNGTFAVGTQIYNEGRLYKVAATGGSGGSGFSPPVHENGTQKDGQDSYTFLNWGGFGYAEITGFTNSTSVNATVILEFSKNVQTANSTKWAFSAWDDVNGFPRAVAFYEDRLYLGGTTSEPQTFWGSMSGDFYTFRINPAELDDTGLQFTLLADRLNSIAWMQGTDVLVIGTLGGEFIVDSGLATSAITPSNIRVRRRSTYGTASDVQPRQIDSSILFTRRLNDMHELVYDDTSASYVAADVTRYNETILYPGVKQLDYQADPFRQLWARRSDGTLAIFTFDKQEDVYAWSDVTLGGTDAFVESVAVIPHPDGDEDQTWLAVRRTVNGITTRHIEYVEKTFRRTDSVEDAFFVDAGATYSGSPATIITGLWHLEGEEVVILADGRRVANQTVSGGTVTLASPASKVSVGLQMGSAKLKTIKWAPPISYNSNQGQPNLLTGLLIRVDNTGDGIEFGTDFDSMDVWDRATTSTPFDSPASLFTGDSPYLEIPGGWTQSPQIAIRYDEPLPCTIVSLMGKLTSEVR